MTMTRKAVIGGLVLMTALSQACFFPMANPYGNSPDYTCKLVPEKAKQGQEVELHVDPAAEDLFITYLGQVVASESNDDGSVHTFKVAKNMKTGDLMIVIGQQYIRLKITVID